MYEHLKLVNGPAFVYLDGMADIEFHPLLKRISNTMSAKLPPSSSLYAIVTDADEILPGDVDLTAAEAERQLTRALNDGVDAYCQNVREIGPDKLAAARAEREKWCGNPDSSLEADEHSLVDDDFAP